MAKTHKGEVNKSQAIRDYLAANKRAKAPAVIAALAEKGIEVKGPLVYAIIGKSRRRKGGTETRRGPKTVRGSNGNEKLSLETLLAAKKLADALGGVEKAQAALDVLAKLA